MKNNETITYRRHAMEYLENVKAGYAAMVWINDSEGREFACHIDDLENPEAIREEEKARCLNVNALIGTERW
jgi:hypothetical protein